MISLANGKPVVECTLHLPRSGVWHADLYVDTTNTADVTGAVVLSLVDGALVLKGSSLRVSAPRSAGLWEGLTRVRIAAGAAGLGTQLQPQGYSPSTPASIVLGDILALCGETLSSTSSQAMLGTVLPAWSRLAQSGGAAIATLATTLGATWRSMIDGTVWLGTETWPASLVTDFNTIAKSVVDGRSEIATTNPGLLPGTTFAGGNVGRVVQHVSPNALRTEVFFE